MKSMIILDNLSQSCLLDVVSTFEVGETSHDISIDIFDGFAPTRVEASL